MDKCERAALSRPGQYCDAGCGDVTRVPMFLCTRMFRSLIKQSGSSPSLTYATQTTTQKTASPSLFLWGRAVLFINNEDKMTGCSQF